MNYLKYNYEFSLINFKLYRPNLITNDGYINHYQKVHRDFKVTFPKIVVTIGGPKKTSSSINSSNSKNDSSTLVTQFLEKGECAFVRVDGILRLKSELKKKQIVVMKI